MKRKTLLSASLIALIGGVATNGAFAQAHFAERVASIKQEIAAIPADSTGTLVMLGDSITQGFFGKDYIPKEINGLLVINEGISGDQIDRPTSSTGVVNRIDLVEQAKPAIIFVLIGINDMWGSKESPEETIKQYEDMVAKLKAALPHTKIVLQSIFPTGKNNAYLNPGVDKVNTRIKELAAQNGMIYLDLKPVLADEKGELKDAYTKDGVHLTPEAYAVWLGKIKEETAKHVK